MNLIEQALQDYWGPKCSEYEEGCIVCDAWREYENLATYGETLNKTENLTKVSDDPKDVLIAGKTVKDVKYADPWGEGITIRFTDGAELYIYERMQAGEIIVMYNGQEVAHGRS